MNHNGIALVLDTDIPEATLIGLTSAVDQLDALSMIIDGILFVQEQDRTLEEYVMKATRYLVYLYDRLKDDDLRWVSNSPLDEDRRRTRISTLLRSTNQGARA